MLIATHDGLLIASTGWDLRAAQCIAAQSTQSLPSDIEQTLLYCRYQPLMLRWTGSLPKDHPVQLRLACRLLRAFPILVPCQGDNASDKYPHATDATLHY